MGGKGGCLLAQMSLISSHVGDIRAFMLSEKNLEDLV